MSQATLPASAMICLYRGAAMKPRFASSKSRLSSNGSMARWPFCSSIVKLGRLLALGVKVLALDRARIGQHARTAGRKRGPDGRQASRCNPNFE